MANTATKAKNPYEIIFRKGVNSGTVARATCDKCGATKEKNLSKHLPPDQVIKKFEQDGWRYTGHGRPRFYCPNCQGGNAKDAAEVAPADESPAAPQRDPDTGEMPTPVGIYIKSTLSPSRGMVLRLPYEVWHDIGKPERVSLTTADDDSLVITCASGKDGVKLQQQGQGQAWVVLTPRRFPYHVDTLDHATKPIHITALLNKQKGTLTLPINARQVFHKIDEWGEPLDNQDKVVKLRDNEEPGKPEPVAQKSEPEEQSGKSLEQEGRDLFDSLNDWIARCLEDNKEVVVTQSSDGYVNARIRYMTEVEL